MELKYVMLFYKMRYVYFPTSSESPTIIHAINLSIQ